MRVLLVSPYFPPQHAVASLRVHSFARALHEAGDELTVLTVAKRPDQCGLDLPCADLDVHEIEYEIPAFFERLRGKHRAQQDESRNGDGSTMKRPGPMTRLRDRRGIFSSVRMPDLTDYWVAPAISWCRAHGEHHPWDVVLSSSGPYTAHLVALRVKQDGLAKKWIADFRDLWLDNHVYRGLFPFTLREQMLERKCLHAADLITTVSTGLKRTLQRKTKTPIEIVYNGFDRASFESLPPQRIFPDDDVLRLVYTGSLYSPEHDPTPLFEALVKLRDAHPDTFAQLQLVVAGRDGQTWQAFGRRYEIEDRLDVQGLVPREDALRMQRDADALILVDWPRPQEGVLTGKLFEYLQFTPPILVVGGRDESPIAEAMTRSRRGRHFGRDADAIASFIVSIANRENHAFEAPDRAFIDSFSREAQAQRLIDRLRALVNSNTARLNADATPRAMRAT